MAERKYLIVSLRGPRRDGNHGAIVERDVAESDLAERERYWHDTNAPCETFHLRESAEESTLDADEHQPVVPVDEEALEAERRAAQEAEDAAERERLARIAAS